MEGRARQTDLWSHQSLADGPTFLSSSNIYCSTVPGFGWTDWKCDYGGWLGVGEWVVGSGWWSVWARSTEGKGKGRWCRSAGGRTRDQTRISNSVHDLPATGGVGAMGRR